MRAEVEALAEEGTIAGDSTTRPLVSLTEIRLLHGAAWRGCCSFPEDFLARYKGLIFQIRSEGVTLSAIGASVKLLKLFAASALVDGRPTVNDGDFFVLKPRLEQRRPDRARSTTSSTRCWSDTSASTRTSAGRGGRARVDLDGVLAELGVIRSLLLGGEPLSDVQLFSQLRNLQDIRAALQALGTDTAPADGGRGRQAAGRRLRVVEVERVGRRRGRRRGRQRGRRRGRQSGRRNRRASGAPSPRSAVRSSWAARRSRRASWAACTTSTAGWSAR